MNILYVEPFYGGSHRDVADNIKASSRHSIELLTLPASHWKWRTRCSAMALATRFPPLAAVDLIVTGGFMSVSDLIALLRRASTRRVPPVLLYAHETQICYPVPDGKRMEADLALTDIMNMVAADAVAFNSRTHRSAFLDELPRFLASLPEPLPEAARDAIDAAARASVVCAPGIALPREPAPYAAALADAGVAAHGGARPLVLWNHRWEFDKNPRGFFDALRAVKARGCRFRLALCGEHTGAVPRVFAAARAEFADELVHFGSLSDRSEYEALLTESDVVVSTAIQENFGVSVMEAVAAGALPLVPNRLSYPEFIPTEYHRSCLYDSDAELVDLLVDAICERRRAPESLVEHARSFAWDRRIGEFDALFDRVAGPTRQGGVR